MSHNTLHMNGKTFVLIPEEEYAQWTRRETRSSVPPLPTADADGNYPAFEAALVTIAQTIIEGREAAGLSQKALAVAAGIRPETLNRIEKGKSSPDTATITKIDRALKKAMAAQRTSDPRKRSAKKAAR